MRNRAGTITSSPETGVWFIDIKGATVNVSSEIRIIEATDTLPATSKREFRNFKPDVGGREVTNSSDKEIVNTGYYYLNES